MTYNVFGGTLNLALFTKASYLLIYVLCKKLLRGND